MYLEACLYSILYISPSVHVALPLKLGLTLALPLNNIYMPPLEGLRSS